MRKNNFQGISNLETEYGQNQSEETFKHVRQPILERVKEYKLGQHKEATQKLKKDTDYLSEKNTKHKSIIIYFILFIFS